MCFPVGGGSSLLPSPIPPVTLADVIAMTKVVQGAGGSIDQLNTLRQNVERLKGGGLGRMAKPAQVRTKWFVGTVILTNQGIILIVNVRCYTNFVLVEYINNSFKTKLNAQSVLCVWDCLRQNYMKLYT